MAHQHHSITLQEAIKEAAIGRIKQRAVQGWSEPTVRIYKITETDISNEKKMMQEKTDTGGIPVAHVNTPNGIVIPIEPSSDSAKAEKDELLVQIQRERQLWRKERNEFVKQMEAFRQLIQPIGSGGAPVERNDCVTSGAPVCLNESYNQLKLELAELRASSSQDMCDLHDKVEGLREESSLPAPEVTVLRREIAALRSSTTHEIESLRLDLFKAKMAATVTSIRSPNKGKKSKSSTEQQSFELSMPPVTPKQTRVTEKETMSPIGSPCSVLSPFEFAQQDSPAYHHRAAAIRRNSDISSHHCSRNCSSTPAASSPQRVVRRSSSIQSNCSNPSSPPSTTATSTAGPTKADDKKEMKHANVELSLSPQAAEDLAHAQNKDRSLRAYLQDSTCGLPYPYQSMSIRDWPGRSSMRHIVLFQKRIYIPASLRDNILREIALQPQYNAAAILQHRYIWPGCMEDLMAVQQHGKQQH